MHLKVIIAHPYGVHSDIVKAPSCRMHPECDLVAFRGKKCECPQYLQLPVAKCPHILGWANPIFKGGVTEKCHQTLSLSCGPHFSRAMDPPSLIFESLGASLLLLRCVLVENSHAPA